MKPLEYRVNGSYIPFGYSEPQAFWGLWEEAYDPDELNDRIRRRYEERGDVLEVEVYDPRTNSIPSRYVNRSYIDEGEYL